mmetsp:Transcript_23921/g.27692  ORF Transcript_23921/g.27692 Transcript_23921/m.27692 type:complete len:125 (+) Transcript_23921:134-508(+)
MTANDTPTTVRRGGILNNGSSGSGACLQHNLLEFPQRRHRRASTSRLRTLQLRDGRDLPRLRDCSILLAVSNRTKMKKSHRRSTSTNHSNHLLHQQQQASVAPQQPVPFIHRPPLRGFVHQQQQ